MRTLFIELVYWSQRLNNNVTMLYYVLQIKPIVRHEAYQQLKAPTSLLRFVPNYVSLKYSLRDIEHQ